LSEASNRMARKSEKPGKMFAELQELRDIYLEILRVEARLVNMEQKHPAAARFRDVISRALGELEDVRHMLLRDAAEAINGQSQPPSSES